MVEREQVVETALDPKNREAAFEIICAQNEIRKRSFDKLKKDLAGKIGYKWSLVWGINDGSKPYEHFLIKFYENSSYSLRFHYEKKNFDQFFIGIYTDTPPHNRPDITAIMKARSADLGLVWNSRDHCNKTNWQCYAYFSDEKLRDWSISTDPWKRIWDGSLAETLFELIEKVYKAFEEQGKLNLLL